MAKFLPIFIALLMASSVCAETFRCKDAAGNTVFTDAPSSYIGCEKISPQEPPSSPLTPPDSQSPSTRQDAMGQPASGAVPAREQSGAADNFTALANQATALVEEYEATKKKIYFSHLKNEKFEARKNLVEIRQRKVQLLEQVDSAGLSMTEAADIRNKLAEIPTQD